MFQDLLFRSFQMTSPRVGQVFIGEILFFAIVSLWFFIDAHIGRKTPEKRKIKRSISLFFLLMALYLGMMPLKLIFAQNIIANLP